MKKLIALAVCSCCTVGFLSLGSQPAEAIPAFKKEFDNLYVKKDSVDPKEKALVEAVETVKCNVCHVGKKRTDRNAYGEELAKLLDKKKDIKDIPKIKQSLEEVGKMPSDASDPNSPTYGDLIKEGKLPCP